MIISTQQLQEKGEYWKKRWEAVAAKAELANVPVYSIPYPQIKKIAALKNMYGDCKKIKNRI